MPRALILSASVGAGHVSSAASLEMECKRRGVDVSNVDLMTTTPSAFRGWYRGGYETLVRRAPRVWGRLYRASDRPYGTFWLQTALDLIFTRSVARLIDDAKPDWVIVTHSLPLPVLASLRKTRTFRTAVVVTDLYPHRMWRRGAADRYFVPTPECGEELEIRLPRIVGAWSAPGIPIHPAFSRSRPRSGVTRKILVSAGAIGGGPLEDVVVTLSSLTDDVETTVCCGKNERTRDRVMGLALPRVEVLGAIPNHEMAERMMAADLLVSKAGGITMFEALATGTPTIIYKPLVIPGQEEDNARFIVSKHCGVCVERPEELSRVVRDLLGHPTALARMSAAAAAMGRPDAAARIVSDLFGVEK